ncbi:hypothetical protein ACFLVG_00390 [Chloroflexota bacterium]
MSKLTPEMVVCPVCGKRVTNRGFQNHVNKYQGSETIRQIRKLPK